MKDKKILKKWWFWVIVIIIVLGAIGSLDKSSDESKSNTPTDNSLQTSSDTNAASTLPKLNADDYKSKEGLVAYKELKEKGYAVSAEFNNQALTDMNGKASDLFEPLDPNKPEDRQSVDAFVVNGLVQSGDNVALTVGKTSD